MYRKRGQFFIFLLLGICIISTVFAMVIYGPERFVEIIGVKNGYLLALFVAFFGGYSAGGSVAFISVLIALAAGGLNPLYLGFISGGALAVGDMIMFYFWTKGRELVSENLDAKIEKFSRYFKEKKWVRKLTPVVAYLYIGFAPLPNDVLLLFLAAIQSPKKVTNILIVLGDFTFAFGVVYLGTKGVSFFM